MSTARSFYQRPLPDGLVAFSSEAGRTLFREALATGHLESFFALAGSTSSARATRASRRSARWFARSRAGREPRSRS